MTTWRDDVDEQTQDELDDLLDASIRAAQQLLDAAGEFYPFALALPEDSGETRAGQRRRCAPGRARSPTCRGLRAVLGAAARARPAPGRRRRWSPTSATGTATRSRSPSSTATARPIEVLLPYAAQGKRNGKKPAQKHLYGDLVAAPGLPRVWA